LISVLCLILGIVIGAGAIIIYDAANYSHPSAVYESDSQLSDREKLVSLAYDAAGYIKSGDFQALSELIHPEYGVYLSPSATLNLSSNRWFSQKELARLGGSREDLVWGLEGSSEKEIEYTAAEFFSFVLYSRDYLNAPVISIDRVARSGNALENTQEVFPGAHFIDLYFPPSSADGIDWSILRLVFEDYGKEPRLAAIVHSEYTY
jgi:hypothetical protein